MTMLGQKIQDILVELDPSDEFVSEWKLPDLEKLVNEIEEEEKEEESEE